jgi:hypothetical protein
MGVLDRGLDGGHDDVTEMRRLCSFSLECCVLYAIRFSSLISDTNLSLFTVLQHSGIVI